MYALNNLQKKNNSLKSRLRHEQLKYGNYPFKSFKKESLLILGAYGQHKSIFKAASSVGVDKTVAMKWFAQGMQGNPQFTDFYRGVCRINEEDVELAEMPLEEIKKDYDLLKIDGSWVYTTNVGGEKISIISRDFDNLKNKISQINLPLP